MPNGDLTVSIETWVREADGSDGYTWTKRDASGSLSLKRDQILNLVARTDVDDKEFPMDWEWTIEYFDESAGSSGEMVSDTIGNDDHVPTINYHWGDAGQYDVDLEVRALTSSGPRTGPASLTVDVSQTRAYTNVDVSAATTGEHYLEKAQSYAERYRSSAVAWEKFVLKNEPLDPSPSYLADVPRTMQLRLLDLIQRQLFQSENRSLLPLLGVKPSLYTDTYYNDVLSKEFSDGGLDVFDGDEVNDPVRPFALLGFGFPQTVYSSGVKKAPTTGAKQELLRQNPGMQTDLDYDLSVRSNGPRTVHGTHVISHEDISTAKERTPDAPTIVRHLQQKVGNRRGIENYANKLAMLLKRGIVDVDYDDYDELNQTPDMELMSGGAKGKFEMNPFVRQLSEKPYLTQLAILAEILVTFRKTELGVKLLADFFQYQGSTGCIDLRNVFDPPEPPTDDSDQPPYITATAKERNRIFASDGTLKGSPKLTPDATEAAAYLGDIAAELVAGGHYYIQKGKGASKSERKDRVATLHAVIFSTLVSDDEVKQDVGSSTWENRVGQGGLDRVLRNRSASARRRRRSGGSPAGWDWSDSVELVATANEFREKWYKQTSRYTSNVDESAMYGVGKLKLALALYDYGVASYEATQDGQLDESDVKSIGMAMVKLVDDVSGAAELVSTGLRAMDDPPPVNSNLQRRLRDLLTKGEAGGLTGTSKVVVGIASKVIDVVGLIQNIHTFEDLIAKDDEDAALAMTFVIGASGLLLVADYVALEIGAMEMTIATGGTYTVPIVSSNVVVAALFLVTIAGTIAVELTKDSPLERWLKHTVYGNQYLENAVAPSEQTYTPPEMRSSFYRPDSPLFGFTRNVLHPEADPKVPDMARQISAYYSMARPIGDANAAAYLDTGSGIPDGKGDLYILIEQGSSEGDESNTAELSTDGALYVRPIVDYGGNCYVQPIYAGPILHRIALEDFHSDRGGSDWESAIPYEPPDAPSIEEHVLHFDWSDNESVGEEGPKPNTMDAVPDRLDPLTTDDAGNLVPAGITAGAISDAASSFQGGADKVLLYPDDSDRVKDIAPISGEDSDDPQARAQARQSLKSTLAEGDYSLDKLAICIRDDLLPLVGKDDLSGAKYRLFLELIYATPEYESSLEGKDVIYGKNVAEAASVSRTIVEVQDATVNSWTQRRDIGLHKFRERDDENL